MKALLVTGAAHSPADMMFPMFYSMDCNVINYYNDSCRVPVVCRSEASLLASLAVVVEPTSLDDRTGLREQGSAPKPVVEGAATSSFKNAMSCCQITWE
jgi:hypothetical protein